jgi:hypothetical protein
MPHAAVDEQPRQHAMRDGGADLRLDVVADHRQAALLEALAASTFSRAMNTGMQLTNAAAGLEHLLDVPLGRLLGSDRQVVHHHVGLGLAQQAHDVDGRAGRLLDDLREVLAEAVVGHAALHRHAGLRHLGEHQVLLGQVTIASDSPCRPCSCRCRSPPRSRRRGCGSRRGSRA